MADHNDPQPNVPGNVTPVPDLIERYRLRRDAWIAQADELARLRDEVRSAAEREAMEIVTAARRDVRQVIMEARRELLVLSAQVQAALGEVTGKTDPATLIGRATGVSVHAPGLPSASAEQAEDILVPEAAVKSMLDEARADMEALAQDAKTVPFQATTLAVPQPVTLDVSKDRSNLRETEFRVLEAQVNHLPDPKFEEPAPVHSSPIDASSIVFESVAALSASSPSPASSTTPTRALLSSPFPSDAVPVPQGRSVRAFVALFVVAGAAVLGGSYWWLRMHNVSASTNAAARTTQPTIAPTAKRTSEPTPPAAQTQVSSPTPSVSPAAAALSKEIASAPLSILVEARRESWIRTTRDGDSDSGRTYRAGEKVQLTANRGISLRAGDAGAVYVSVNKGAPVPLGRDGEVITRLFVAERAPGAKPSPVASEPTVVAEKPALNTTPTPLRTASAPAAPPIPVPLVQPSSASNAPAIQTNPAPAVARNEPPPPIAVPRPPAAARNDSTSLPSPRAEAINPAPAVAPPTAPPVAAAGVSPANAVVAAARQWLDAYHRQERTTMAALSTDTLQLADERRADERFPANVEVNRSLDRVSVQIAADTAVLTAVMTERGDAGSQKVSPVSQVWVLSSGQWRVKQVRLVSEARLNQIFR